MPGIRDEKKRRTRETILEAAKRLFLQRGYDRTTTEQIAVEAHIGAGTVFNYFDAKADILIAVIADEIQADPENEPVQPDDPHRSPAELIYALVESRTRLFNRWSKELIREILSASLSALKSRPAFLRELYQFDDRFIREVQSLIERWKTNGRISRTIDGLEAAEVLYGILLYEFMAYLFNDEQSYEACLRRIRGKLEIVMSGWTVKGGDLP